MTLRSRTSIASAVALLLVLSVTPLLGVLAGATYWSDRRSGYAELTSRAAFRLRFAAEALTLPVLNLDREQIERFAQHSLGTLDIAAMTVGVRDPAAPGVMTITSWHRRADGAIERTAAEPDAAGDFVNELPITVDGETVGYVKIHTSTAPLEQRLNTRLAVLIASIVAVDVLLVLTVYILLWRLVILPLKQLESYAANVSGGAGTDRQPGSFKARGELLSLRTSLEQMVRQLEERYQQTLRSSAQYQAIFSAATDAIFIMEGNRFVDANDAAVRLFRCSREDFLRNPPQDISPPMQPSGRASAELAAEILHAALAGKSQRFEWLHQRFDGTTFTAEVSLNRIGDRGGNTLLAIVRDITERKHAQAVLMESEKMRMIAGLAAGMAHEINNPLAGMLGNAQVILNRVSPDLPANRRAAEECGTAIETVRAYLERRDVPAMLEAIRASGARAAEIITNMLSFSRTSGGDMILASVHQLIDRTLELASAEFDLAKRYDFQSIALVRDEAADLPAVPMRTTEMQQVLLNLLKNGAQAMLDRGQRQDPPRIAVRTRREDDMAVIEIEDNGPGMTEEVRRRIFEPFFTTKKGGSGVGLGLFLCYHIVTHNHHGRIEVQSQNGRGTTFRIHLPLTPSK